MVMDMQNAVLDSAAIFSCLLDKWLNEIRYCIQRGLNMELKQFNEQIEQLAGQKEHRQESKAPKNR